MFTSMHCPLRGRLASRVVALLLVWFCWFSSAAAECLDYASYEPCSYIVGTTDVYARAKRVAVSGDYAYVTNEAYSSWVSSLQVIDISNPAAPQTAGSVELVYPQGLAVEGSYAYVADYSSGLKVIDVSNPANPWLVGSMDIDCNSRDVAVSGSYAFVADGSYGFRVIDVSGPSAPQLVQEFSTGDAYSVAISGDYAYVGCFGSEIQVFDVSDPRHTLFAGSVTTPGAVLDVEISGGCAYAACKGVGLVTIDVADPANPQAVGQAVTPGDAYGVAIAGGCAYVTAWNIGLTRVDITDPADPQLLAQVETPSYAYDVAISDDCAYVADFTTLQVIDISVAWDYPTPVIGSLDTVRGVDVAVTGDDYCYTLYFTGLQVIEVSDPSSPQLVGSLNVSGEAFRLKVSGDYAYVADGDFRVIDISNPTSPELIGSVATPGLCLGVAVSGGYAYIADATYGLHVIDITNPADPLLVGSSDTPGGSLQWSRNVAVSGDYAYVADDWYGLTVVDISDPADPRFYPLTQEGFPLYDVCLFGNYAVAGHHRGLIAYDLSNPAMPQAVGSDDTGYFGGRVELSGGLAYVASSDDGMHVVDISDPTNLLYVGGVETTRYESLAIGGDCVYAIGAEGLQIYPPQCPDDIGDVPDVNIGSLVLHDACPNPFNPLTTISFDLPKAACASLRIYDASGRLVRTLLNHENAQQGRHQVVWTGRDDSGRTVSSGVYFYRLEAGEFSGGKKLLLIK